MRIFGSERMDTMLTRLGLKEDEAIVHPWINKALEKAQKKVEARNFDIRKNLLKYDDVMNDQRKVIFEQRLELMDAGSLDETVADMRHELIETLVAKRMPENAYPEQWETAELTEEIREFLNLDLPIAAWADEEGIDDQDVKKRILDAADAAAADREQRFGADIMRYIERSVVLQTIDALWREHLVNLDHLRSAVGFRGYAQRDPLNEYKSEAFELFQVMLDQLRERVTQQLMRVELVRPETDQPVLPEMQPHHIDATTGEDEFGQGGRAPLRRLQSGRHRPPAARPRASRDLGRGVAQRTLPLRLGQEVQALPRRLRAVRLRAGARRERKKKAGRPAATAFFAEDRNRRSAVYQSPPPAAPASSGGGS